MQNEASEDDSVLQPHVSGSAGTACLLKWRAGARCSVRTKVSICTGWKGVRSQWISNRLERGTGDIRRVNKFILCNTHVTFSRADIIHNPASRDVCLLWCNMLSTHPITCRPCVMRPLHHNCARHSSVLPADVLSFVWHTQALSLWWLKH